MSSDNYDNSYSTRQPATCDLEVMLPNSRAEVVFDRLVKHVLNGGVSGVKSRGGNLKTHRGHLKMHSATLDWLAKLLPSEVQTVKHITIKGRVRSTSIYVDDSIPRFTVKRCSSLVEKTSQYSVEMSMAQ